MFFRVIVGEVPPFFVFRVIPLAKGPLREREFVNN